MQGGDRVENVVQPGYNVGIASKGNGVHASLVVVVLLKGERDTRVFLVIVQRCLVMAVPGQSVQDAFELRPRPATGEVIVNLDAEAEQIEFDRFAEAVD